MRVWQGPRLPARPGGTGERYIGEVPKTCRGWLQRPAVEEPSRARRGGRANKPRVRPGEPEPQTVEEIVAACRRGLAAADVPRGDQGPQQADFARVRFIVERDDLPGPELWLVIERGCEQQTPIKYYLSNASGAARC